MKISSVAGEESAVSAGQLEMVSDVGLGLLAAHADEVVVDGDAWGEGFKGAAGERAVELGQPAQHEGEDRASIHLEGREQAELAGAGDQRAWPESRSELQTTVGLLLGGKGFVRPVDGLEIDGGVAVGAPLGQGAIESGSGRARRPGPFPFRPGAGRGSSWWA